MDNNILYRKVLLYKNNLWKPENKKLMEYIQSLNELYGLKIIKDEDKTISFYMDSNLKLEIKYQAISNFGFNRISFTEYTPYISYKNFYLSNNIIEFFIYKIYKIDIKNLHRKYNIRIY